MNDEQILYIHGRGGKAEEADYYRRLFPEKRILSLEYSSATPWEFKEETSSFIDSICSGDKRISIIAVSIGAYFAMHAFSAQYIKKAFFISPVLDMERLIRGMMMQAGIGEAELKEKKVIETGYGDPLSWEYLEYAVNNPVRWPVSTEILYGTEDSLVPFETVVKFAETNNAGITAVDGAEHWFHTEEQMKAVNKWIKCFLD